MFDPRHVFNNPSLVTGASVPSSTVVNPTAGRSQRNGPGQSSQQQQQLQQQQQQQQQQFVSMMQGPAGFFPTAGMPTVTSAMAPGNGGGGGGGGAGVVQSMWLAPPGGNVAGGGPSNAGMPGNVANTAVAVMVGPGGQPVYYIPGPYGMQPFYATAPQQQQQQQLQMWPQQLQQQQLQQQQQQQQQQQFQPNAGLAPAAGTGRGRNATAVAPPSPASMAPSALARADPHGAASAKSLTPSTAPVAAGAGDTSAATAASAPSAAAPEAPLDMAELAALGSGMTGVHPVTVAGGARLHGGRPFCPPGVPPLPSYSRPVEEWLPPDPTKRSSSEDAQAESNSTAAAAAAAGASERPGEGLAAVLREALAAHVVQAGGGSVLLSAFCAAAGDSADPRMRQFASPDLVELLINREAPEYHVFLYGPEDRMRLGITAPSVRANETRVALRGSAYAAVDATRTD